MGHSRARLLVLGGGAAGLLGARTAAARGGRGRLLEANDRVGKKLLATGNGRCNLSNRAALPEAYGPAASGFLLEPDKLLQLMEGLGLATRTDEEGRVYPLCNQASAVLDVLRLGLERENVETVCGFEAVSAAKNGEDFCLVARDGRRVTGQRLLLCAGGRAASKANGYALAQALGHRLNPLAPALTYLKTDQSLVKGLQGQRLHGCIRLCRGQVVLAEEEGELLFKEGALSGIAVFDLSRAWAGAKAACELSVDLLPGWDGFRVRGELERRAALFPRSEQLLTGLFPRLVGQRLLDACGLRPQAPATSQALDRLAALLRDWRFPVTGSGGFDQAQLTLGGVPLDEVEAGSLRSLRCEGLSLAGEMLDLHGPCGGFNLHQAFSTGYLAAAALR